MNRKNIFVTLLILLPAITGIVSQVVALNTLVIDGKKISGIESKISALQVENKRLELEISKLGTIETIADKAEEQGLEKSIVSFVPGSPKLASSN